MVAHPRITTSSAAALRTVGRRCATVVLWAGFSAMAACGPYPRDVEGTLSSIQRTHVIHIGLIAGTDRSPNFVKAQSYIKQIAEDVGAKIELREASTEALLAEIEQGSLDLAIGEIATDSPWLPDVAIIEPIAERRVGQRSLGLSAIARNGENQWIMLLERHARNVRARP